MDKLKAYWKWVTGVVAAVGVVVGAIWGGGEVVVKADDWKDGVDAGIVVAQSTRVDVDKLLEMEKLQAERERAAAEQEREKWRKILELCLNGTIPANNPECARATAALK